MAFAATRVLIVNKQLQFAVGIKQALEHTGKYEVTAFTTATAALEHLRDRPYDVVLLDFTLTAMPGPDMVMRFRSIQPDIAIIASPDTPEVAKHLRMLKLNGIVDFPVNARDLMPVIQRAVSQTHDSLPDTAEAPTIEESETLVIDPPDAQAPTFTTLDSIIVKTGGLGQTLGTETLDMGMDDDVPPKSGDSQSIEVILRGKLSQLDEPDAQKDDTDAFEQLAAEEPPTPSFEDSGTLRDFMTGIETADPEALARHMITGLTAMRDDEDNELDDTQRSAAQMVLETALDDSQALRISLAELINSIEAQFPDVPGVKPLPSWVEEIQRFVQEPDFLEESLPPLPDEYDMSLQTTNVVNGDDIEDDPGNLETDIIQAEVAPPPPGLPEMKAQPPREDDDTDRIATGEMPRMDIEHDVDAVETDSTPLASAKRQQPDSDPVLPPYEFDEEPAMDDSQHPVAELPPYEFDDAVEGDDEAEDEAQPDSDPVAELPPYEFSAKDKSDDSAGQSNLLTDLQRQESTSAITPAHQFTYQAEDDPKIAQLALALTQASLELTTDATLLSRDGQIVAYVGSLPYEDVQGLEGEIAGDWDASPGESRIRYISLPGSGQDYMLYSRQTEYGFTLSMIFAGNLPLRVIRRQSKRLVEALETLPQIVQAPDDAAEDLSVLEEEAIREEQAALESTAQIKAIQPDADVEAPVLGSYTYIWLIRDPDRPLNSRVAQAIVGDLDAQLLIRGWKPDTLHVFEDYVVLTIEAPVDDMTKNVINDLKHIAAEIVHRTDDSFDPETLWADSYFALTPGRKLHQDEIQHFINFARLG